ncbi:MAG: phosphotransferase [Microthrixaceae bacterium]|nr:phosphotransferase [Microthrixaceae bacterium]
MTTDDLTPRIATDPDHLGPEWLSDALAPRFGGGRVTGVAHEPVGTGQVGDAFRLRLTLEGAPADAPTSLIAKLPAADPASRAAGVAVRSYELECRFYQQLASDLPVRTPRCHLALFDPDTHDFTLIFEDLAPAQQGDQIAGCSADEADLALRELALLHGPRFGDPGLEAISWLNRRGPEDLAQLDAVATMVLPGFAERYGDRMGGELLGAYERLTERLTAYLDAAPRPFTITHGDFRLDNLLFGVDGDRVGVVDFQGVAHGPGGSDRAYFLGGSPLPEVRRAHEGDLVAGYHCGLSAQGVEGYSLDDCWAAYRHGACAGMLVTLVASMLVEQTERGDEMFVAMGARHARHALDLGTLERLG